VAYEGRRRIYRAAADELGAMRGEMHGTCLRSTPALIHVPSGSRTTARSSRSRRSTPRSGTNACRACARSKARRRASLRKPRRSCASTTVERCPTSSRVRSRRRRTSCPQACADPEGECACTPFPPYTHLTAQPHRNPDIHPVRRLFLCSIPYTCECSRCRCCTRAPSPCAGASGRRSAASSEPASTRRCRGWPHGTRPSGPLLALSARDRDRGLISMPRARCAHGHVYRRDYIPGGARSSRHRSHRSPSGTCA
jgi:hypothetical protein